MTVHYLIGLQQLVKQPDALFAHRSKKDKHQTNTGLENALTRVTDNNFKVPMNRRISSRTQ